ncbi:MAG: EAL domain-containing protein [Rhizobiaceae bacterium]|nr:EAL domain-containing protein [Rhizobiaceae bacterium]
MAEAGDTGQENGLWALALERAQLGVWDWNLRTGDCYYAPTWAKMLGYTLAELPDRSDLWLQLTHPDDRERATASGDRHLAGLTEMIETEMRFRHKDGHWVWVLDRGGIVERDAEGKPLRMIGVQTDITRQKATEAQLEQVNARFRLALAASGTGIWHHDNGSATSFWDARTREIYGVPGDACEVSGTLWHTFLHPEDRVEAERAHEAVIGSDQVSAVRYRIVRRDGEVRYIESLLRFIDDPQSSGQLLGTVRDVTEEQRRQLELAHAARHDALTGLLNRTAFDAVMAERIAALGAAPLAVLYVDLDFFKALNDFAGHAAGDSALRKVAAAMRACLPHQAVAARLGGDEFSILAPVADVEQAQALAAVLLEAVSAADLGDAGPRQRLGASIGIALVRDRETLPADALACADDACYAAKASGRGRAAVFSTDSAARTSGLNAARVAADTVDALCEGRLLLYGQKIHGLGQPWDRSRQVEILARLTTRGGQMISPEEFIPAAERFGMAPRLDRWIIRTALTRFRDAIVGEGLSLNFNLSAQTLSDPGLWSFVDATIDETGVPHSAIVFEITETAAITSFAAAERFVGQARERSCRVSLDDFGAGLSSFDYLRRFTVDSIKIDGSFVQHMANSRFDREIVTAITGIARSLGYSVVAEKIETAQAQALLMDLGVEYGQGYLLHRPEPLEAIVAGCAQVPRLRAPAAA